MKGSDAFSRFSRQAAKHVGHPTAFALALLTIVVWVASGPVFKWSDTWQLIINTGTTIVTFLMVFLIQNTQNRDSAAVQLKLDELIRATRHARNSLVDLENCTEEEIEKLRTEFEQLAGRKRTKREAGAAPNH